MDEIVFVCTGNTCRSPMAEELFRICGGEEKLGLKASSAGTFAQDGMQPSPYAVEAVEELGGDLRGHHARQLTPEIIKNAKYVVCMTGSQVDQLSHTYPQFADKFFEFTRHDIPDPFGGTKEVYRRCAALLKVGVEEIIAGLEKKA